jgi:uncharacterized protein
MQTFKSPFFLPNSHFQTIFPSIFRKVKDVNYQRERINTPDNDFLDLDWSFHKIPPLKVSEAPNGLIIISHGLEGSAARQYVKGMVKIFNENGYDCVGWNFRSCSGETNKQLRFYHSGATDDLDLVVKHAIEKGYENLFLVGFSLGGNLTLKYLGEKSQHSQIKKAVVFSVPLHLSESSKQIGKPSNWLYEKRFLRSLSKKIKEKAKYFPNELNLSILGKITTLKAFDDQYTSKLHGFINAEDYYAKNSSIIFVENIAIPTLVVNALNDPFLSDECYPSINESKNTNIQYEFPQEGGHCGFYQKGYQNFLWSEIRALEFISLGN